VLIVIVGQFLELRHGHQRLGTHVNIVLYVMRD